MTMAKLTAALTLSLACAARAAVPVAAPGPAPAEPITLSVDEEGDVLVRARFEPIRHTMDRFHERWDELRGFKVARDEQRHPHAQFRGLLPGKAVAVGDTWTLPPDAVLPLLRQLHPGATLDLHLDNGDSRGAFACLRAYGPRYAEVMMRVHCDFVLREGHLTPGQMAGRLVLDRRTGRVAYFHLHLPPALVNFDTNWKVTVEGDRDGKPFKEDIVVTDSGAIPRLELVGGAPLGGEAEWTVSESDEQAAHRLALRVYKYKQIEMTDFARALEVARRTGSRCTPWSWGGRSTTRRVEAAANH